MTKVPSDDKRTTLLHDAAAALSEVAVSVVLRRRTLASASAPTLPAELHRRGSWRHQVLFYPVLGALGHAVVERIASTSNPAEVPVIVAAAAIGPELRRSLLAQGFGYLDLAGNCHFELDGGKVTVHIEGRRRSERTGPGGTLRAAGYQALFTLLANPQLLERTVRDIGAIANTSRHAVQSLLARLRDEGLLYRAGRSRHIFAPGGQEHCIDRFSGGWADALRDRLMVGRFRMREQSPDVAIATIENVFRGARIPFGFGGAHGATRWQRYLQSEDIVVHVEEFDQALVRELGAAPDRSGPLTIFRTMTQLDLASGFEETAHPLLVHAELARSPNPRARETAALLLNAIKQSVE